MRRGALLAGSAALVLGVALRVGHAWALGDTVAEWEADGFVRAWEGRPFETLNRLRPPALDVVLDRLVALGGEAARAVFGVRLVCIVLSLLAFGAAVDLAGALARRTGLGRRSLASGAAWMALCWAVHPTLVAASVAPTPEVWAGGAACLTLAWAVRRVDRPVAGTLGLAVAVAIAALVGGVVLASGLVVAALVYLLPVPPLGRAVAVLGAVSGGLLAAAAVQRGPAYLERPWLPDTAGVAAVRALADPSPPLAGDLPADAARRELERIERAVDELSEASATELGASMARRLVGDLMGPRRLAPLVESARQGATAVGLPRPDGDGGGGRIALGLLDLFLRGGLLLFGLTVLGLVRRDDPAAWPRAGPAVGFLVWLLLAVAICVGPWALAPLDLVLLGVAGAGVVGGDPRRAWTRRLAFVVGGGLLCSLAVTGGWRDRPLSPWVEGLHHPLDEGALLVDLLDGPGPRTVRDEIRAANLLMRAEAPLLRLPHAALAHAYAATRHLTGPDDPAAWEVDQVLIRALVENGLYEDAARLAEGAHAAVSPSRPGQARHMSLMLDWVQEEQRRARSLPVR